jgi:hypothetical protein
MSIDLSSVVPSALTYLNMGLSVLRVEPSDNKAIKHFKRKFFQQILPTPEQVDSFSSGTDVNIAIATGATSLIHRLATALQMRSQERREWP